VLNDFLSQYVWGVARVGYSTEVPIEALLESRSDHHPTELMTLLGARLALARESQDVRWNEGRIKRLTGGDRVTARRMRQDFVDFAATHKLVVFGNVRPRLRGSDQAAWKRRLHLIPFSQLFDDPADPSRNVLLEDKNLMDKLMPEAPGVLHTLINAGIERLRLGGLRPPATVIAASAEYLLNENILTEWLDERCDRTDAFATETADALWKNFRDWGEKRRRQVGQRNEFNGRLERLGIKIKRTSRGPVEGEAFALESASGSSVRMATSSPRSNRGRQDQAEAARFTLHWAAPRPAWLASLMIRRGEEFGVNSDVRS
jgi:putative DNA primase/helicase